MYSYVYCTKDLHYMYMYMYVFVHLRLINAFITHELNMI